MIHNDSKFFLSGHQGVPNQISEHLVLPVQIQEEYEDLEKTFQRIMLQEQGDAAGAVTWLGKVFDRGGEWVAWFLPQTRAVKQRISEWIVQGFKRPQPEQNSIDLHRALQLKAGIAALHARVQTLLKKVDAGFLPPEDAAVAAIACFKKKIDSCKAIIEFRLEHDRIAETQENALVKLNTQTSKLRGGKNQFSPHHYETLIKQSTEWSHLQEIYRQSVLDPAVSEEIERKIAYQLNLALVATEEFIEVLVLALEAERNVDACSLLINAMKACAADVKLPDPLAERCRQDLNKLEMLRVKIRDDADNAVPAAEKAKKQRARQKRNYEQIALPANSRSLFWRFFFFYLQASAPLLPVSIVKRDYNHYLRMMARASQSGTIPPPEESYEHYLAQARLHAGIDEEFVENYHKFLQGEIRFFYTPFSKESRASNEVHPRIVPSTSSTHSSSLPFFAFLGTRQEPPGHWEYWAKHVVYPIVKGIVEGPVIPVSDKLCVHILGDSFGMGTGLEGLSGEIPLHFRIDFLAAKIRALQASQGIGAWQWVKDWLEGYPARFSESQIIKELQTALDVFDKLKNDSLTSFARFFRYKLAELKPGGVLFFPGGWVGETSKHMTYYWFRAQENGLYTHRIYNTGDGLEYHAKKMVGVKEKYLTFVEKVDISLDHILQYPTLRAMQELGRPTPAGKSSWNSMDLYHAILGALGGVSSAKVYGDSDLRDQQTAGICSFYALSTLLSHHPIYGDHYTKNEFEWQLKTLADYAFQHRERMHTEERPRRLLRKSMEVFARTTPKLHRHRILEDAEYRYAGQILQMVSHNLEHSENIHRKLVQDKAGRVLVEPLESVLPHRVFSLPPFIVAPDDQFHGGDLPFTPVEKIDLADYKPSISTFRDDVKMIVLRLSNAAKDQNHRAVTHAFKEAMDFIPLTWFEKNSTLWETLQWAEAEEIVCGLSELVSVFFKSLLMSGQEKQTKGHPQLSRLYLAHLKGVMLIEALVNRYREQHGFPQGMITSEHLLLNRPVTFGFDDPEDELRMRRLRDFCDWEQACCHKTGYVGLEISAPEPEKRNSKQYRSISKYDWVNKETAFFPWIKRQILRPETRKKLLERFPNFEELSPANQGMYALSDEIQCGLTRIQNKRDLFPRFFYGLRDAVHFLSYLRRGPLAAEAGLTERQIDIVYFWRDDASSSADGFFYTHVRGAAEEADLPVIDIASHGRIFSYSRRTIVNPQLNSLLSITKDTYYSLGDRNPNRKIHLTRDDLGFQDFTVQEFREMLDLFTEKELHYVSVLAHFMKRPFLLEDPDYQTFFDLFLFEPNVFLWELQGHPVEVQELLSTIADFIHRQYRTYTRLEKFETALYFLHLNHQFMRYIASHDEKMAVPFLNIPLELKMLLKNPRVSGEARAMANLELALIYHPLGRISTRDQALDFLTKAFLSRMYPISEAYLQPQKEAALEELLFRFSIDFKRILDGKGGNDFLNLLAKNICPHFVNSVWSPHPAYPIFHAFSGEQLDISRAIFHRREGKGTPRRLRFPEELIQNSELLSEILQISRNDCQFVDGRGEAYRIIREPDGEWCIQSVVKDQSSYRWYQNAVYKLGAKREGKEWVLVSFDLVQASLAFMTYFEEPRWILPWKNRDTDFLEEVELPRFGLSFVFQEHKFYFLGMEGFFIAERQRLPQLDDFPYFLLLEHRDGREKVLIPRNFLKKEAVKNRKEIGSLDTSRTVLAGFDSKENPLADLLPVSRHRKSQGESKRQYFDYVIDGNNGLLIAGSDEGRFYLGMVFLWKLKYFRAMNYLRGQESVFRALSEGEGELLNEVAFLGEKNQDFDPRALSVRLFAFYRLLQDARHFPAHEANRGLFDDEFNNVLCKTFEAYLANRDHAEPLTLNPDEEIVLLESIELKTEAMRFRLSVLRGDSVPPQNKLLTGSPVERPPLSVLLPSAENLCRDVRRYSAISHPSSVLRASGLGRFLDFYAMARELLPADAFSKIYESCLGIPLKSSDDEGRREELALVLQIMKSNPDAKERGGALLLEMILKHPDRFPPLERISQFLEHNDIDSLQTDLIDIAVEDLKQHEAAHRRAAPETGKALGSVARVEAAPHPLYSSISDSFQKCLLLNPSLLFFQPVIHSVDEIRRQSSPCGTGNSQSSSFDALLRLFSPTGIEDSVLQLEFNRVKESLQRAQQTLKKKSKMLCPPGQSRIELHSLKEELKRELASAERSLGRLEEKVLTMVNACLPDSIEQVDREFDARGLGKKPLVMQDLLPLFSLQDASLFHAANPALSFKTIEAVNRALAAYLLQLTYRQHLARLTHRLEEILSEQTQGGAEEEFSLMVDEFLSQALTQRAYAIDQHPRYLVFEAQQGILLRKEQVDQLEQLQKKPLKEDGSESLGVVSEMIMGAGKSAVITPLLADQLADGKALVMAVVLEELLPTQSQALARHRAVQVMQFSRDMPLSAVFLNHLHSRMKHIISNRQLLVTSGSSIQSLYLKVVECLYRYAHGEHDLAEELEAFRQILRLLKGSGKVIIDEIDHVLRARGEHHFTLGNPESISAQFVDLVCGLYRALGTHPEILKRVQIDFVNHTAPAFSKERYHAEVEDILREAILDERFDSGDPAVKEFFRSLLPDERMLVDRYLSGVCDAQAEAFVKALPQKAIRDLLALAKEELCTLIPLTNTKYAHQNYGLNPGRKQMIVIPFHGSNNPAVKSQFRSVFETLNLTLQFYLRHGIPLAFLLKEIDILKEQANQNLEEWPQSKGYQKWRRLSMDDEQFSLFGSDVQWPLLLEKINADIDHKLFFIKEYIAPEIVEYPITLSSNPQIFNFLFNMVVGFTGSQENDAIFPARLEVLPSGDTLGKTLLALWEKSRDQVYIIPKVTPEAVVENIFFAEPPLPFFHAFIDVGGYGRGIDHMRFARDLLALASARSSVIKGVVFFDAAERLMMLERGKKGAQPFDHTNLGKEERLTFYDEKHSTGVDVKQPFAAKAIVTIGRRTTLRDLIQAVWRMRGIELAHQAIIILDEEVKDLIEEVLAVLKMSRGDGMGRRVLSLGDVFLFVAWNQSQNRGGDNFLALREKIKAVLLAEFLSCFRDQHISVREIGQLFLQVEELFVTLKENSPWNLFGATPEDEDRETAVQKMIGRHVESKAYQALQNKTKTLRAEMEQLAKVGLSGLSKTLPRSRTEYDLEVERETEKEKETEAEKELEGEQATQRETEKEAEWETDNDMAHKHVFFRNAYIWGDRLAAAFRREFYLSETSESVQRKLKEKNERIQSMGAYPAKGLTHDELLPFVSIEAALSHAGIVLNASRNIFDPNVFGSLNLLQIDETSFREAEYRVFGRYQKNIVAVLVIEDKQSLEIKLALLDEIDAIEWRRFLRNDERLQGRGIPSEVNLCMYQFNNRAFQHGFARVDWNRVKNHPSFLHLIVQAKFFNGETFYNKQEVPYLEHWLNKANPATAFALLQHIFKFKASSRKAFATSVLGHTFEGLGADPYRLK